MMDTFPDGTFRPAALVSRGDLAQNLVLNTALRQSLADAPLFGDVTGSLEAIAEAVGANGSTLRDYDFTPAGTIPSAGSAFNPGANIARTDLAVAFVRALGLDAAAQAKAGSDVTVTYQGQTLVLTDENLVPAGLRGYVQFALDKGILQATFSLEQGPYDFQPTLKARVNPNDPVTRAFLAYALDHYRQSFAAGN